MTVRRTSLGFVISVLAVMVITPPAGTAPNRPEPVIVTLQDGVAPAAKARGHRATPSHLYRFAIRGYAASLPAPQIRRIEADPDVLAVLPDEPIFQTGSMQVISTDTQALQSTQQIPTGVRRIGGLASPTASINGVDERVDVDVAIIDTGIQSDHPDLNVAGGENCAPGSRSRSGSWEDRNGHGTHVGGIVGALDNDFGRVGVAPGARLWAVKVLNDQGKGPMSSLLCGIDWVTAHGGIEVANMSLGGRGIDTGNCGMGPRRRDRDAVHAAICASVAAGTTYVTSAGNEAEDVSRSIPAAYPEVITVSAFGDSDGEPGGLGPNTCIDTADDTFAHFSNFGPAIDISAPGVCISSTWIGSIYAITVGTSMAAPHVAGGAALYLANHPESTPAEVMEALLAAAEPGPIPGDPDEHPEGIVRVDGF